ncbi:MAG: hypothetical protein WCC84_03940, partial [Candidatus Cybelea sp.]
MLRVAAAPAILLAAATAMMKLGSLDFQDGGVVPSASMATDCGGKNRSPALAWRDEPKTAKSFALIVH